MKGSHKIGLELVAQVLLVLVLASADDTISGTIGDDVDSSKAVDCKLDYSVNGLTISHVTHGAETVLMVGRHII